MEVKMHVSANKRRIIYSVLSVIYLSLFSVNCFSVDGCHAGQRFTVDQIITDTYNQIGLGSKIGDTVKTQTLAYLGRPGLRQTISCEFENKINSIGPDFFKEFLGQVLSKELLYKDDYVVFYHGQQRQFMALQDIYQDLFESVYKKTLQDFFMMRVPGADFEKFGDIHEFLHKNIENGRINRCDFDEIPKIKKRLLAVNPCLFGNSRYLCECSFYYFIYSSNASGTNFNEFISRLFEFFKLHEFYENYFNEISEMLDLLSAYEEDQTGVLLQIFVPKSLVDNVAYRCRPWGLLHYDGPENHMASVDLDYFQNDPIEKFKLDYDLDSVQFRVLMNPVMLDPSKGAKFFRYGKETANVKKYKNLRSNLSRKISSLLAQY